jgi:4'-phosphopantetheinyl transferase
MRDRSAERVTGWHPPAGRPRLLAGEVHLWLADTEAAGWPGPEALPVEERERAAQMRQPQPRGRWVAARWVLRRVLAAYLDREPRDIRLSIGAQGKPALAEERPAVRFNLSHSGSLALVGVASDREVGVDVEEIDVERDVERLAPLALGGAGAAALEGVPASRRAEAFHQAWAHKEAAAKCSGVGLTGSVDHAVWVSPIVAGPGAVAALATRGGPPVRVERFLLSP